MLTKSSLDYSKSANKGTYVVKKCQKCPKNAYCKVASFNTSRLEAHAGFFRLLMKGIFDPYVL